MKPPIQHCRVLFLNGLFTLHQQETENSWILSGLSSTKVAETTEPSKERQSLEPCLMEVSDGIPSKDSDLVFV